MTPPFAPTVDLLAQEYARGWPARPPLRTTEREEALCRAVDRQLEAVARRLREKQADGGRGQEG